MIDTYDTEQGARNAAIVAKELEAKGKRLGAVRLDSGDLCELSKKVRDILDKEGLRYVSIFASNDLNEYKIEDLIKNGARIDGYGVGTEMITAKPVAAISGVYKLVHDTNGAKIKLAPEKKTYPGIKQVFRVTRNGKNLNDILGMQYTDWIDERPLLEIVARDGKRIVERKSLQEIRAYSLEEVAKMPDGLKLPKANGTYKVEISEDLQKLVDNLTEKYGRKTK